MVLAPVEHPAVRGRTERRGDGAEPLDVVGECLAGPARSSTTPLARAIRPASRSSPSDTSIIAVAPATAAAGPAASGDVGCR